MKINREEFAVETINAKEKIVKFYVVEGQQDLLTMKAIQERANKKKKYVPKPYRTNLPSILEIVGDRIIDIISEWMPTKNCLTL